ncbi:hypothetical protein BH11PLA2_BH11PLA2_11320 [soil metagenome]
MIVQKLHDIQHQFGFLPDDELKRLAKETNTPLYRLQEIVSFFPHFRQEWAPPPHVEVHVCRDVSCHLRGAPALTQQLKKLERSGDHAVEIKGVSCLGRCDRAPAVVVNRHGKHDHGDHHDVIHEALYAGRTHDDVVKTVEAIIAGESPTPDTDKAYSDAKISRKDWQIDVYAADEFKDKPYDAIRQFLKLYPEPLFAPDIVPADKDGKPQTLEQFADRANPWMSKLTTAGLTGFGGAGIPAYLKWFEVWKTKPVDGSTDKYIVCNGDESEPSTFKDRELLLQTPHLVIEGVILAGLMTNAKAGYIYVRHEYMEQIASLKAEIERAKKVGACGIRIFGTGRDFPVEVFTSPGGYICGEESALIEAMEDRRGQPRNKPPEMQTNGLYDKPTVVNNVETLAWVPAIMLKGGEWYAKGGTNGARGRRFFSLCGDLEKPGVFEVKTGTTLGDLIKMAGGLRGGQPLTALALSGPSGGLVPGKLQVPADFEARFQKNIDGIKKRADGDKAKSVEEHTKKIAGLAGAELEAAVKAHTEALAKIDSGATRNIDTFTKLLRSVVPVGATHAEVQSLPLDKGLIGTIADYLKYNLMLGAGIAVYAGKQNVLDHALRFTEFFRNESCGKCVPCRIGSQKLVDLGQELYEQQASGKLTRKSLEMIRQDVLDVNEALKQTSICGLGRVAGSPLSSTLVYFEDELAK